MYLLPMIICNLQGNPTVLLPLDRLNQPACQCALPSHLTSGMCKLTFEYQMDRLLWANGSQWGTVFPLQRILRSFRLELNMPSPPWTGVC